MITVTEAVDSGVAQEADSQALHRIADRLMWWQSAAESLERPRRFIAQVMVLGNWDDMQTTRRAFGDDALRETLRAAPPGIFDLRSWTYWHQVFRLLPVPPLPQRKL
jgi:hypothetical protein